MNNVTQQRFIEFLKYRAPSFCPTSILPPLVAGAVGVLGSGAHPCQGSRGWPAGVHVLHGTAGHLTGTEGLAGPWT